MTNHAQPHQHLNKNEIVHVVQQMVDAATKAILPHFRMGRVLTENKDKHGFDPVTVADRDARTSDAGCLIPLAAIGWHPW